MKLLDFEFLKNVKIGDFTLGFLTVVNLLYPAFITWYISDKEFLLNANVFVQILSAASIGFMFNAVTFNNLIHELSLQNIRMSFENLRNLMPAVIGKQAITFSIVFSAFLPILLVLKDEILSFIDKEAIVFIFFFAYSSFSAIEAIISRKRLKSSDDKVTDKNEVSGNKHDQQF